MKYFIIILSFLLFSSIFASSCIASSCPGDAESCLATLDNPLGGKDSNINEIIGTIIHAMMGIVGSLALAMFVYGGFTWMTAAGANEKVQKGKDIVIWATIGLIVIFSSYALVYFIIQNVIGGEATSSTSTGLADIIKMV